MTKWFTKSETGAYCCWSSTVRALLQPYFWAFWFFQLRPCLSPPIIGGVTNQSRCTRLGLAQPSPIPCSSPHILTNNKRTIGFPLRRKQARNIFRAKTWSLQEIPRENSRQRKSKGSECHLWADLRVWDRDQCFTPRPKRQSTQFPTLSSEYARLRTVLSWRVTKSSPSPSGDFPHTRY